MSPNDKGRDQCVHEKLLQYGTGKLDDAELMSLILGTETTTANNLLTQCGGLRGLEQAGLGELCENKGIGRKRATAIKALVALSRRLVTKPLQRGQQYTCSSEIFDAYGAHLGGLEHEEFWCLLLNCRNQVLKEVQVARGSVSRCPVEPQELFAPALREKARRLILLHNHPTGNPEPSQDDRALTRRLVNVAELIGIEILDHVVIGDGRYVSFADRGWL